MKTISDMLTPLSSRVFALLFGAMLMLGSVAQAQVVITITESGDDLIIASNGGTLDLTGLTKRATNTNWNMTGMFAGTWSDYYGVLDGETPLATSYNSGGTVETSANWTNVSAFYALNTGGSSLPNVLFSSSGVLYLDPAFSSGGTLSAFSATLEGKSYDSLGLTANEYASITWSNGSVTLQTMAAVPEPSTYAAIFGALAFGAVIYRRKRR